MAKPSTLRTLWTLLKWEGGLTNERVRSVLGLQHVQASRLIGEIRQDGANLAHDPSARSWLLPHPAQNSQVDERGGDLDEYANLLGRNETAESWLVDARPQFLEPAAATVRMAHIARRGRQALLVRYHSMSDPKGRERVLYPHTIVRLSQRWHLRAWCAERREYRDFNLGRMKALMVLPDERPAAAGPDTAWETLVDARIKPHSALDADFWDLVRQEYFPGASARVLRVRGPLLHYTLQGIQAAVDPATQKPPQYLLELDKPETLKAWLFPAP